MSISNYSHLKDLFLVDNLLETIQPLRYSKLDKLETLDLRANKLTNVSITNTII